MSSWRGSRPPNRTASSDMYDPATNIASRSVSGTPILSREATRSGERGPRPPTQDVPRPPENVPNPQYRPPFRTGHSILDARPSQCKHGRSSHRVHLRDRGRIRGPVGPALTGRGMVARMSIGGGAVARRGGVAGGVAVCLLLVACGSGADSDLDERVAELEQENEALAPPNWKRSTRRRAPTA